MPTEPFSIVLGKLRGFEHAGVSEPGGPALRLSSDVALVMLSIGAVRSAGLSRKPAYYDEETLGAAPPLMQGLSLAELKERIGKAKSISELRQMRRDFARARHPDHHKQTGEAAAASEMAAANVLIDEAISLMRRKLREAPQDRR